MMECPTIAPAPVLFGEQELAAMFKVLGVRPHPMLALPTLEQVRGALASEEGKAELIEHLKLRGQRIELALKDPLNWGFEMDNWKDADRLLNNEPRRTETEGEETPISRIGTNSSEELTEECLILGIFGGNRATKSVYAIKRACQTAVLFPGARIAIGAESELSSIATVQTIVWQFLQPLFGHLNGKRDPIFKVNHSQAGGFTDRKLVLPNRSEINFITYNQNPGDYEGWEFGAPAFTYAELTEKRRREALSARDQTASGRHASTDGGPSVDAVSAGEAVVAPPNIGAVMDESMPLSWLKMLSRRLKFRKAKLLWPFTPVKGITPAIKELVGSSARTIESRVSELLPRRNFPDLPEGHMPYIRECAFPRAKAIYFFSLYNKFGPSPGRTYYDEIKELCAGKESGYVERVAYGMARDSVARAFPTFGPWNMVKREHLPAMGTNYFFCDPAGARNWASFWVRVGPPRWGADQWTHYIYRDWPDAQSYGEWAVATEREVNEENRKGWDGDAGPAQAGFGYGVTRYKQVFLAAEGGQTSSGLDASRGGTRATLSPLRNDDPYRERLRLQALKRGEATFQEEIAERYVDPRAGASEHLAEKGGTCIIDEFEAVQMEQGKVVGPSMELIPASGVNEDEGLTAVNEMLDWNREQPLVAVMNQPHLFVCEDCQQVRWMFENFTGRAGAKGACKDFADLARYMALAKLEFLAEGPMAGRAGRGF